MVGAHFERLRVERIDDHVVTVGFDQPSLRNALGLGLARRPLSESGGKRTRMDEFLQR